jgi:beta-galactosidase
MKPYKTGIRQALSSGLWLLAFALINPAIGQQKPVGAVWKFTTGKPAAGWETSGFADTAWQSGPGGFGGKGQKKAPGSVVNTEWSGPDIWLRRTFELKEIPSKPALFIHHDEDAEIFLNGRQIAKLDGFTTSYVMIPLEASAISSLKAGINLLAIHCHQKTGGQYIDAHIIDADSLPDLRSLVGGDGAVHSDLITEWGAKVTAENAWREYPRPQLQRKEWTNLNGHWDYTVTTREAAMPSKWTGKILVPFPIESKLSGVRRMLQPYEALWYRRTLEAAPQAGKRTRLNFEAIDYQCRVWINDKEVGSHTGGNLPFSFDITDALRTGPNTLTVRVEDATGGSQLRGKQTLSPGGIFYTRNSGIWQTVWLEQVSSTNHITSANISSSMDGTVNIGLATSGPPVRTVVTAALDGRTVTEVSCMSDRISLPIKDPQLWSPEHPHLYDLKITLLDADGKSLDEVISYTGIREVGRERDKDGNYRFTLNKKPIFHWGPLDQGWWPDGLLTPPSDAAMKFEIQWLKDAGFNMIRKHIKVEPQRYYYHCDRIGMLVWQDQVSGGQSPPWTRFTPDPKDAQWSDDDHRQWLAEFDRMISLLGHFPSIVVWTPFNEAWGQHRTMEIGAWTMKRDPSRLVNIASGGNFWETGHIADEHRYPHPGFPLENPRYKDYVKVVGEFGGHGWPVKDHLWDESKGNWGYGGLPKSAAEYRERYEKSISILTDLKAGGVSGGVYTQTTDVEEEINGLMTYDRKVMKIPAEDLKKIHAPLMAD